MNPLEPVAHLEWITKHQLAGYGWQHAVGRMKEEDSLHQVANQTKSFAQKAGREVATFVYREAQCADPEYTLQAPIINDPSKAHWWLQQNGTVCKRFGQFPDQQQFNFSVPEVRDFYIDTIIKEVAAEDGTTGSGIANGGEPACFIVEKHLSRFVEGQDPRNIELMW